MATFTDTIKLVLNMDVDKSASGGLKTLKTDIENTDGAWGKMKTGASGAMDFVKSNALGFAAGAGTAIAGFAVSSINDFQEVAGAVGGLRDALGLSAEDASRWVEVAGDLGIGADKLETSMGKMLRTAGSTPDVFKDLGVQIAYAKDGSVDANQTFLNVIDRLNEIRDPALRAATAQKLLGKAWMDSAELIGLGADGVKARLDEVSGAKIITDDQISQSRRFRDAMDDLGDRVDSIKLQIAEGLIPALTALADVVGPVVDGFGKVKAAAEKIGNIPIAGWITNNFIHPFENLKTAFNLLPTDDEIHDRIFGEGADDISAELAISPETLASWDRQREVAEHAGSAISLVEHAFGEFGESAQKATQETKDSVDRTKSSTDGLARAVDNLDQQWQELTGSVSEEQAFLNIRDTFDSIRVKAADAWNAAATGAADAGQKGRDYRQSLLDAQREVINLGQQVGLSIPQTKHLQLLIDRGDIDAVERELNILTRNRTMNVSIETHGGAALSGLASVGKSNLRAKGGPVTAGEAYIVGDKFGVNSPSAEVFVPDQSGMIYPKGQTSGVAAVGGGTGVVNHITINMPPGTDGRDVVNAIKKYERANGAGWRR